jgi:hypothetical protein
MPATHGETPGPSVAQRRRQLFEECMACMAADSAIQCESAAINSEFEPAEGDELPD